MEQYRSLSHVSARGRLQGGPAQATPPSTLTLALARVARAQAVYDLVKEEYFRGRCGSYAVLVARVSLCEASSHVVNLRSHEPKPMEGLTPFITRTL